VSEQAPSRRECAPEDLASHYEALRRQVLGCADPAGRVLGWALLARQGMVAWIRACAEIPAPAETPMRSGLDVPADLQNEIVRLLAGMALGRLKSPAQLSVERSR
jgi:hypothetical protein